MAVLMGGPSAEYDVSLSSGKNVCQALNKEKYEVLPLIISRSGEWQVTPEKLREKIDIAFLALHGEFGEDGTVQSMLEEAGIVYTGSNPLSSALGMNKIFSSLLFRANDLAVPEFMVINKKDGLDDLEPVFDAPWIVKPANRGSSVGMTVVREKKNLIDAVRYALLFSRDVMIEKYIYGRELTCGVIDDGLGKITPLIPTEIIPKTSHFFDYQAKYTAGASEEITPPRLTEATIKLVQEIAAQAHRIIGASGMSRTDMILAYDDHKLYVLEINTIPGMTPISLLPQGAQAAGLSFSELLDKIIQAAFNRQLTTN